MNSTEVSFAIILTIVFILKALAFIPGVFDYNTPYFFTSWINNGNDVVVSIWGWLVTRTAGALNLYLPLFCLVAFSLLLTILSYIPLFANAATMLVFTTFFTSLVSATGTCVYFFHFVNSFGFSMTSYNYFGAEAYIFFAAEGLELVLLVLSVIIYSRHRDSTKWGRF
jgi:hypothetical protein